MLRETCCMQQIACNMLHRVLGPLGCKEITLQEFKNVIDDETKNLVHVLADFGFTSPESKATGQLYIDIMGRMMLAIDREFHVAVAFSSGMGWLMAYEVDKRKEASLIYQNIFRTLKLLLIPNFSYEEVKSFVTYMKLKDTVPSENDLFTITNGNPLLLGNAIKYGRNYDKYTLPQLIQHINDIVLTPILFSIVKHVTLHDELSDLFGKRCDEVAALAEAESIIPNSEYLKYSSTWYVKENLVYAVECGADVTLHTNFPNSYRSIMRVLHDNKVAPKSVTDKPQVQGYLLEEQFFEKVQKNVLQLSLQNFEGSNATSITLNNLTVVQLPSVKCMAKNAIYRMMDCHPAVDAVLYYSMEAGGRVINYLFFFQISLSCYSQHKAKACGVHQTVPHSARDGKPTSILNHYRSLVKDEAEVQIVYVYISPRELTTEMIDNIKVDAKRRPSLPRKAKGGKKKSKGRKNQAGEGVATGAKPKQPEVNAYGVIEDGSNCSTIFFDGFS